jgi:hypothetical protein
VIRAVAFCPHPPLLVPALAQGAAAELEDLRAACRVAVKRVAGAGGQIVVVGAGTAAARHDAVARGTLAGYGVPLEVSLGSDDPGPTELPLSLTIGAWLLRDTLGPGCGAVGYSLGPDGSGLPRFDAPAPISLVVMGDGSARRSTSAPGYLDERAQGFDAAVAEALRSGDPAALRFDAAVGAELLAAGTAVWNAVGAALAGRRWSADLLYDAAPYGVGYFVATWMGDG